MVKGEDHCFLSKQWVITTRSKCLLCGGKETGEVVGTSDPELSEQDYMSHQAWEQLSVWREADALMTKL